MWKFLTRDAGLKIAALLLALFVWLNIAERRPVEVVSEVPIEYANVPEATTVAPGVPAKVRVRVGGTGVFVRWQLKDVRLVVDLAAAELGVVTHVLSPGEVVVGHGSGLKVLEIVEPKAVKIELREAAGHKSAAQAR
jgi:YbbR domain-containing protein